MTSDELGMQLHDRATRGEALAAEEQSQLEQWYASQDAMESDLLQHTSAKLDVSELWTQVEAALAQLTTVTQRIQQITMENEVLRREIAVLQQQLISA